MEKVGNKPNRPVCRNTGVIDLVFEIFCDELLNASQKKTKFSNDVDTTLLYAHVFQCKRQYEFIR